MMYLKPFDAEVPLEISKKFVGLSHLDRDDCLHHLIHTMCETDVSAADGRQAVFDAAEKALLLLWSLNHARTHEPGWGILKHLDDLLEQDVATAQNYLRHLDTVHQELDVAYQNQTVSEADVPIEVQELTLSEYQAAIHNVVGYLYYLLC